MSEAVVEVSSRAASQVARGSLWIYSNEFKTKLKGLNPGQWVCFQSQKKLVGYGYVNPHSLIAGRILSREFVPDRRGHFLGKFQRARELRRQLGITEFGSYRLCFSEGDELPGLIVDCYEAKGKAVVIAQPTTAGMDEALDDWSSALTEMLKPDALAVRADSSVRRLEGIELSTKVLKGDYQELSSSETREADVKIACDFAGGQKTGFFIDQRDNRQNLKLRARGLRILDLCCYSGGWGLSALKAGASHVSFVDQSAEALHLVERGAQLNEISASRFETVESDVFDFLSVKHKVGFDIVVCDPPAFVKSKQNLSQAVKAYKKLNRLALRNLSPGGILYTCSCSFHISDDDFIQIVKEACEEQGVVGSIVYRGTQSLDHPWIANRPETHYLKCLAIKIL